MSIGTVDSHLAFIPDDFSAIYTTDQMHIGWGSHIAADKGGMGYSVGVITGLYLGLSLKFVHRVNFGGVW
ncbi:hypothetical protein [Enterovibrio norvegicus]|uniref:hypothetical protein n=1 Tax=Enterovibrio norvegicus TaxID=188144 RepID=UPI001112CC62|nr:hypothetical protein [Enterovibrio norvegicus]